METAVPIGCVKVPGRDVGLENREVYVDYKRNRDDGRAYDFYVGSMRLGDDQVRAVMTCHPSLRGYQKS